ncbi:MAG: ParB/RepB/Spo0J family partition protein [Desulfobacula sp.]|jgi:ParB/RepB/Spo0J family partition protein|nr:ParB/RepB/Spo0J family partition protein [Desulfobacula sp.]MBT6337663.1 ParB/RepB/Spo0J family partition protein [Desulfobacula sp.]
MKTQIEQIDIHQIILRYEHTRVYKENSLNRLRRSMERFDQIAPVLVIPAPNKQFVLVDGYLRVKIAKMCGRDTVLGLIWVTKEQEALLSIIKNNDGRQWEIIEQASLLNDYVIRFKLNISQAAKQIGRDKSWVKRRLALVRDLPEDVLDALRSGHISAWSAARVLAPLARANKKHAQQLTSHLKNDPISTRQLKEFFNCYKKSNHLARSRMIEDPPLFLKASLFKKQEQQASELSEGLEGKWLRDMNTVRAILKRLRKNTVTVIYSGQEPSIRKRLVDALHQTQNIFKHLNEEVTSHDQAGNETGHKRDAKTRDVYKRNLQNTRSFKKHSTQGYQGQTQ